MLWSQAPSRRSKHSLCYGNSVPGLQPKTTPLPRLSADVSACRGAQGTSGDRSTARRGWRGPILLIALDRPKRAYPVLDIAAEDEGTGAGFYGPELPGFDLRIDVGAAEPEGGAKAVHREGLWAGVLLHRLMLRHRFLMNLQCETQPMMLAKIPTRQQINICGSIIHNVA